MAFGDDEYAIPEHEPSATSVIESLFDEDPYLRWDYKRQQVVFAASLPLILSSTAAYALIPALPDVAGIFNCSIFEATLALSSFNLVVGLLPTFYNSITEKFGRLSFYMSLLAIFFGASLMCAGSFNIWFLILNRAFQALGASGFIVIAVGVLNDVYRPKERSGVAGNLLVAAVFGPIFGPLIGGAASTFINWRWIFLLLAFLTLPLMVAMYFWMPETLDPKAQARMPFRPVRSFLLLLDWRIACVTITRAITFSGMYVCIWSLPLILYQSQGLNAFYSGAMMVPFGIATEVGGSIGLLISRRLYEKRGLGGLIVPFIAGAFFVGVSTIAYAWTAPISGWVGITLAGVFSTIVGFFLTFGRPGLMLYSAKVKEVDGRVIAGAIICVQYIVCVIFLTVASYVYESLQVDIAYVLTGTGTLVILSILPSIAAMVKSMTRHDPFADVMIN